MSEVARDHRYILSIQLDDEGVVVHYTQHPFDVRVEGQVSLQHVARIEASHPDYRDDIEDLVRVARRLLANALEDWETSDPFVPRDEDDDDERGMGE